ncbi:PH domain-containing protein [Micromonospora sp. WMMD975]|uniref:PH domain-containing protein n=1 Tax=Micromonospora sp. WMMD975 TaxID=3016087 RepID=UPI00249BEB3C|nr:PH domain-containing protein [Micromonospora sp. WMMD975]WFE36472.1 PH domain-containing protein [Micromonospora sp. WMMD975]
MSGSPTAVTAPEPAVPAGPTDPAGPGVETAAESPAEAPWRRLDRRVIWLDLVMFLLSLTPSFVALVVLDVDFSDGAFGIWPLAVATFLGVTGAVRDLLRWMKTRYRITDERVELRVGWLHRRYRYVPRDRVRSVDATARLRHRLAGLRIVHIGTGEAQPALRLNAVSVAAVAGFRRELLVATGTRPTAADTADTADAADGADAPVAATPETPIAELRWSWLLYNLVNIWAFLAAGFLLWSLFWLLQLVNVDLRDVVGGLVDWQELGNGWSAVIIMAGSFLLGVIGLGIGFVTENWNFRLVRVTTENGTALLTRRGLTQTREIYRDDRRLRGVHTSEPLFWRWLGLAETEVVSTGLAGWTAGQESASVILPRTRIGYARRVAADVLADGVRPLDAPTRAHARAALYRRLLWAVGLPGGLAAALAWLAPTSTVPDRLWLYALAATPVTLVLAVIAYRSLGHTLVEPYVVTRYGLARRYTTALQRRAVIGWKFRQSLLQRIFGLTTLGIATAAGARHYEVPDLGAAQAVAFAHETTPDLLAAFVVRTEPTPVAAAEDPQTPAVAPGSEGWEQECDRPS